MSKRKTKLNHKWAENLEFIFRNRKDDFHVFFAACRCDVEIINKGKNTVYQYTTIDNIVNPPFPDQAPFFRKQYPPRGKFVNDHPLYQFYVF